MFDDSIIGEQWRVVETASAPAIETEQVLRVPRCDACSQFGSFQRRLAWHPASVREQVLSK